MKVNEEQRRKIDLDQRGNPIMTIKTIKYFCWKDCLYDTPQLNEKLYLHYKGFKKIQSLEHYPNLVTVWLNNNCISTIENLSCLPNLICLYLNNNSISKIENLEGLDKLCTLHLAHNRIDKIEGIAKLKSLSFLNVSQNFLHTADSVRGLKQSSSLTSIDLSKNQLQCSGEVFEVISSLENITCLCMRNTPLARTFKNYRKRLTAALKALKYLDDRSVKVNEHRLAEAWARGGVEQQNNERARIAAQVEQKNDRESAALNEKLKREKKREEDIRQLQSEKASLQQQQESNQEQIQDINRRLQILRDGPKGFQLKITKTSIKILNVPQSQQEETIDRYFQKQKKQIEQNLKKMSEQNISIREVSMAEYEEEIENKVRKALHLDKVDEIENMTRYKQNWNENYSELLQALLIKQKFNFARVVPQFNKTLTQVHKKMLRRAHKFSLLDLQYAWTDYHRPQDPTPQ